MGRISEERKRDLFNKILSIVKERGKISIQEAMALTGAGRATITNIFYKIKELYNDEFEIKTIHKQKYLVYLKWEEEQEKKKLEIIKKLKEDTDNIVNKILEKVKEENGILVLSYEEYKNIENMLKNIAIKLYEVVEEGYDYDNLDYSKIEGCYLINCSNRVFILYRKIKKRLGLTKQQLIYLLEYEKENKELLKDIIQYATRYNLFKFDFIVLAKTIIKVEKIEEKEDLTKEILKEVGIWE